MQCYIINQNCSVWGCNKLYENLGPEINKKKKNVKLMEEIIRVKTTYYPGYNYNIRLWRQSLNGWWVY